MATNDHGKCPKCNSDLNGGSIWDHFFNKYKEEGHSDRVAEKKATEVALMYGATKDHGKWGRAIGIEKGRDRIEEWECPDCKHRWPR